MRRCPWICACIMLAGVLVTCTPEAPVTAPAQLVEVYASPAAQPWLPELYACAPSGTVLRVTDLPAEADIALRLGEPEFFTGAAYQVGTEQVLVVGNHQSPLQDLTAAEVRDLFAGLGDPALQIWVYSQGEDVQALFTRVVMGGRAVTTQARLATSPEHMSNAVVDAPEAVGILPGRWKTGDVRVLYTLPDVPVLALVRDEPQGSLRELLACIQK